MNKIIKYEKFMSLIKEGQDNNSYFIPTYDDCVEMCSTDDPVFYESKFVLYGYNISIFNYRLAQYKDFVTPLPNKPATKAYEMRGLTFVFNTDGSIYNRYLLLEKFFNLNQVPESMYSIVKDYKIKYVNNKEDGSIASFIQLPNGKVCGKSKMGFDNEQANGINRIYKTNGDISSFVDWCLDNDITPIFEYVAPHNRIVLRYSQEELILLRLRNNTTGKHLDIKEYYDKLGTIKVAPFDDDFKDLDNLIELTAKQIDKEGSVVQAIDKNGNDFFFKLKTPWYMALHGLLTDDIYKENKIIEYILDDRIDDILGQIPEEQVEARDRINKIINIVKDSLYNKSIEIEKSYDIFLKMGKNRKEYALLHIKDPNFAYVMQMNKGITSYELAKKWLSDNTKRLMIARDWLKKEDPSLFFRDPDEELQDQ
jgi:T4 RnlA family RNA ligase